MQRILRPQVEFHCIDITKGGGVYIEWTQTTKEGSSTHREKYMVNFTTVPHEAFTDLIKSLDRAALKATGYNDIAILARAPYLTGTEQKAFSDLKNVLNDFEKAQLDKISVNGISFHGEGKTAAVVIKVQREADSHMGMALNPKIMLERDTYKIEEEVKEIAGRIKEEAFCFIFEGKKSQTQLNFDEETEAKPKKKGSKKDPNQVDLVEQAEENDSEEQR